MSIWNNSHTLGYCCYLTFVDQETGGRDLKSDWDQIVSGREQDHKTKLNFPQIILNHLIPPLGWLPFSLRLSKNLTNSWIRERIHFPLVHVSSDSTLESSWGTWIAFKILQRRYARACVITDLLFFAASSCLSDLHPDPPAFLLSVICWYGISESIKGSSWLWRWCLWVDSLLLISLNAWHLITEGWMRKDLPWGATREKIPAKAYKLPFVPIA